MSIPLPQTTPTAKPAFQKDGRFYLLSGAAGATAACLSHVILVPIDVLKTRIQLNPKLYPNFGSALKTIVKNEGVRALSLGLTPTFVGYSAQGFCKYGLYEFFKTKLSQTLGQEFSEKHATGIYLAAGTTAEVFADLALTPFEAVRIRMVAQPTWASSMMDGLGKLYKTEGMQGLYKGLSPLMMKQVPYTAVKFAVFEATEDALYQMVPPEKAEKGLSKVEQLGITTVSGFIGGVASAVASHPADSVLTKLNAVKTEGSTFQAITSSLKALGFKGMWNGVVTRMMMVGVLASFQLLAYDATKVMFGLPVSQGVKARHGHQPHSHGGSASSTEEKK